MQGNFKKTDLIETAVSKIGIWKVFYHLFIGGWALLIILTIRPLVKIYFAPLATSRIGHFILNTEILLSIIEDDNNSKKICKIVFWIPDKTVSNEFVFKIWQHKLKIVKHNTLTTSIYISILVYEKLTKSKLTYRFKDWDGYLPYIHKLEKRKSIFNISKEDEQECFKVLKKQGIDVSLPWVCLLARDNGYLENTQPELAWNFNSYRNSNIDTYMASAEWLANKKVITFRMGNYVEKSFSSKNQLIVDYANSSWRNDKLDIFLSMKCLFFLSTSTGLDAIPIATGIPLLVVNLAQPLTGLRSKSNHIFIIKKFYSKELQRFINLNEYTKLGEKGGFSIDNPRHLRTQDFEKLGITIIDNTSEEILDATKEMYDFVLNPSSHLVLSENQQRYWQKFPIMNGLDIKTAQESRIGKKFINQNLWLIE